MTIQQGFYWLGPGHGRLHGGIDYIFGKRDRSATWKSFPVYAAASGYACANLTDRKGCIVGVGNRVLITHTIRGRTYRSYYGHLRAISKRIPLGGKTVFVKRGELLGYSGYSGDPCCVTHLHFQLFDPHWKIVDPYGIYGTRAAYPDPAGRNGIGNGSPSYWTTDPPTQPASFTDVPVQRIPYPGQGGQPTPRPKPTPTPRPRPARTQRPRPTRTHRPKPTPTPRPARTPRPTHTPGPTATPGSLAGPSTSPGPPVDAPTLLRALGAWVTALLLALRSIV
jgi:hypothetical protein